MPEGVDPHSFRSTFGHNTNIWAFKQSERAPPTLAAAIRVPRGGTAQVTSATLARLPVPVEPSYARVGPPASLAPLDYDVRHKYFVEGGAGAARRPCAQLPPEVQVAHRCTCTAPDACGALAEKITRLAAEGKLGPFPIEGRSVQPEQLGIETW